MHIRVTTPFLIIRADYHSKCTVLGSIKD